MNRNPQHPSRARRGFTIIEVLIAVIIIAVLAVILIPVLTNRVREAKLTACARDMEHIVEAQKQAAVQMNYYLRLYALDDIRGGDGQAMGALNDQDGIADEALNTAFYTNPTRMFINPENNQFLSPAQADALYATLGNETNYKWTGPYYNIQRDEKAAEHDMASSPRHLHGIPNDPWGNDYLLFFRGGVLLEPEGVIQNAITLDGTSYPAAIFDRPTLLSVGPDGKPGDNGTRFGEGDDQVRSFEY